MLRRLDAHAHFFRPGFVNLLPESCRRLEPDEVTLYAAYAERHGIEGVLAVGFEGEPWANGNNRYLAELARSHAWLWPLAFVARIGSLTSQTLDELEAEGFVGISLYLFDGGENQLAQVDPAVWEWLAVRGWLISVNSTGDAWLAWQSILEHYPTIHLIIAHLGLPPASAAAPTRDEAAAVLASVTLLADYPHVHVKLSGLYALSEPAYAYPHVAAWPFVDILVESFGVRRLVWGSDFSPALEVVSFDQTVAVIDQLPGLSADDKAAIWGGNLRRLLDKHEERRRKR